MSKRLVIVCTALIALTMLSMVSPVMAAKTTSQISVTVKSTSTKSVLADTYLEVRVFNYIDNYGERQTGQNTFAGNTDSRGKFVADGTSLSYKFDSLTTFEVYNEAQTKVGSGTCSSAGVAKITVWYP